MSMSPASGRKIVFLGGGSIQFTPKLISDFIRTPGLHGSAITLVDVDEEKLRLAHRLAKRLIECGKADLKLDCTTDRKSALPGADFVIISVEINRFPLWKLDRSIPKEFGIEQAHGENGGPGGLFHALRQIPVIVEICEDVEKLCPRALVINLSNPMSRILQAVHEYTKAKFVGSCHEIGDGNSYLSSILNIPEDRLRVTAAGLNHFTWYLDIRDGETGNDLYPMVRELAPVNAHIDRLLVADLLRLTGCLCVTSDSHVGEYLGDGHIWRTRWASDMEPFDFFSYYELHLKEADERMRNVVNGTCPADELIQEPSGEVVTDMISAIDLKSKKRFDALNLPNRGYISNLPSDCIVEVPTWVNGGAFEGESVGSLPALIAGWLHREATIHHLNAKAAIEGNRQAALEAMLLDPVVPDRFMAEKCLDAMLEANRAYLPRFYS
jgi:alpha-galactosidase